MIGAYYNTIFKPAQGYRRLLPQQLTGLSHSILKILSHIS